MAKRASDQEPLTQRVLDFIQQNSLIAPQSYLLVAVSGGADSVCLLHLLVRLKETLGIRLHIAHLNHQLRGAEAEDDAGYVANLAQRLGIPATIEQREVKAYQARHKISLEEAAREVRYNFLAQVAQSVGASRVAVGHTRDDNIETILMHLVRGSGTKGLRGLQPKTEWCLSPNPITIIRPLLPVSREETASYCQKHQLAPRVDSSNLSLSPLRNRIRLEFLPRLKGYNPGVTEALLRTARIAADDFSFLEQEGLRIWGEIAQSQEKTVTLDKEKLLALPPALQRHLLRQAIESQLGSLKDIEARHIEIVMNALTKPAGRRLNLPYGLIFSIEYQWFRITKDPSALSPFPAIEEEYPLNLPGETSLPGWQVTANIINRKQLPEKHDGFTAYLDRDKTGDKLTVRSRRPGDRFQPLGMSQFKKLGEFMVDAKIPRDWRASVPLVCSPEQIVWMVGWRIDERVKVSEETKRILCLEFTKG